MSANWQPQIPVTELMAGSTENGPDSVNGSRNESHGQPRKKIVVVGLGMVGIGFMCVALSALWAKVLNSLQRKTDEARRQEEGIRYRSRWRRGTSGV